MKTLPFLLKNSKIIIVTSLLMAAPYTSVFASSNTTMPASSNMSSGQNPAVNSMDPHAMKEKEMKMKMQEDQLKVKQDKMNMQMQKDKMSNMQQGAPKPTNTQ